MKTNVETERTGDWQRLVWCLTVGVETIRQGIAINRKLRGDESAA
jgi:hypothetical protein